MTGKLNRRELLAAQRETVRELIRELEQLLVGETAAIHWLPQVLSSYRISRTRVRENQRSNNRFVPAQLVADTEARLQLTPRESEVLEQVVAGYSNQHIANELACSSRTVEVHVSRLLEKSNCVSRAELIARTWAQAFELESV